MAEQTYMQTVRRTTEQTTAALFGVIFLVVGIAGFIPGVTTELDRLSIIGGEGAHLLGTFGVNWLENVVHLAYGAAGLWLATSAARARAFFLWGGLVYGLVWLYGMVIDLNSEANFIGVNEAGNWLHFALFVVMVGLGAFFLTRRNAGRRAA